MDKLKQLHIPVEVLQCVQPDWAEHYRIVPFEKNNGSLFCYGDKNGLANSAELKVILGKSVEFTPLETQQIDYLLSKYYRRQNATNSSEVYTTNSEDDLLEGLIAEAMQIGSSDIHIEMYEQRARVRMRVDGRLIERFVIKTEQYPILINKIKIQAKLDIAEKRLPQTEESHLRRWI